MRNIMTDFKILGPYDPPTGWKEILGELNNSNTAPPSASASGGIIMKYMNTLNVSHVCLGFSESMVLLL